MRTAGALIVLLIWIVLLVGASIADVITLGDFIIGMLLAAILFELKTKE